MSRPDVPALWRRSLDREIQRKTQLGALVADVSSTARAVPGFGVSIAVHDLPAGAINAQWLTVGDGPLLSPAGERTWNALLTLAQELAEGTRVARPLQDGKPALAAVVLTPAAIDAATQALPGAKREAA